MHIINRNVLFSSAIHNLYAQEFLCFLFIYWEFYLNKFHLINESFVCGVHLQNVVQSVKIRKSMLELSVNVTQVIVDWGDCRYYTSLIDN